MMDTESEHKAKAHWSSDREHDMTVCVCGDEATVYDYTTRKKWTMTKKDGAWPENGDPRRRIGKRMVEWCEGMTS